MPNFCYISMKHIILLLTILLVFASCDENSDGLNSSSCSGVSARFGEVEGCMVRSSSTPNMVTGELRYQFVYETEIGSQMIYILRLRENGELIQHFLDDDFSRFDCGQSAIGLEMEDLTFEFFGEDVKGNLKARTTCGFDVDIDFEATL